MATKKDVDSTYFVDPFSILGFGSGICDLLLARAKALKNSEKFLVIKSFFFRKCVLLRRYNEGLYLQFAEWNNLIAQQFLLEPLLIATMRFFDWELSKMFWYR